MAHEVETLAFVNELPWHGLGVDLSGIASERPIFGDEFRSLAGLDWTLRLDPIESNGVVVPDFRAVVRETDGAIFSIVGKDYRVINPEQVFGIPDELVAQGLLTYETAGSLCGGRIIFALAKMRETEIARRRAWLDRYGDTWGGKDTIENFVLWTSRNDGNGCRTGGTTRVRVVCKNTYDAAFGLGFGDRITVQHKGDVEARIAAADKFLVARIKQTEAFARVAQELADTRISLDGFRSFASDWLDEDKGALAAEPVTSEERDVRLFDRRNETRAKEIESLVAYFTGGTGNVGEDKLDAYNAVTEFLDHTKRRYNAAKDMVRKEGFFASTLLGGRIMKSKGRALNLLRKA